MIMLTDELKHLTQQCMPLIEQVSAFIKSQKDQIGEGDIQVKDANSLVTYVDQTAERQLVDGLSKLLPHAAFVTEEDTVDNTDAEYTWIVDPLDGTTNFIQGLPFFSISVALKHRQEVVLGIVKAVMQNECFKAWKGGGAYLDDHRLDLQHSLTLDQALVATGFPYNDKLRTGQYVDVLHGFLGKARGIRRLGSAALDLAYVAAGRFGGYYEQDLNIWDLAGGAILVKEAGGLVSGFHSDDGWMSGQNILAAHRGIYSDMRDNIIEFIPEPQTV